MGHKRYIASIRIRYKINMKSDKNHIFIDYFHKILFLFYLVIFKKIIIFQTYRITRAWIIYSYFVNPLWIRI
jgi:hypothetical protein